MWKQTAIPKNRPQMVIAEQIQSPSSTSWDTTKPRKYRNENARTNGPFFYTYFECLYIFLDYIFLLALSIALFR